MKRKSRFLFAIPPFNQKIMHFLFENPPFMRKSRVFANPPFKQKTRVFSSQMRHLSKNHSFSLQESSI
ncbi:hypothetical protein CP10743SC13_1736 [Chlamydia psittaci 10_743_SC13]|nr:hypothetical protein CP10743SC13_1736 [Chlamydia psittaci 10_743_SC13]